VIVLCQVWRERPLGRLHHFEEQPLTKVGCSCPQPQFVSRHRPCTGLSQSETAAGDYNGRGGRVYTWIRAGGCWGVVCTGRWASIPGYAVSHIGVGLILCRRTIIIIATTGVVAKWTPRCERRSRGSAIRDARAYTCTRVYDNILRTRLQNYTTVYTNMVAVTKFGDKTENRPLQIHLE